MSDLFAIDSKFQEASSLFGKGRYYEAALLVESAARLAEQHKLDLERAKMLLAASYAWEGAGNHRKALDALLRIRESGTEIIGSDLEFKIQKQSFDVMFDEKPDLGRLEERLREADRLSRSNSDSNLGEVIEMRSALLSAQGRWKEAFFEEEAKWANRESHRECIACNLSDILIKSLRSSDAKTSCYWLDKMLDQSPSGISCRSNVAHAECHFELKYGQADGVIRAAERFHSFQRQTSKVRKSLEVLNLRVRAYLLNREYGDPADNTHPALQLLLNWRQRTGFPREKFVFALLVLDYRLAALRYMAGMAACDDYYYQQGQETIINSPSNNGIEIKRRMGKVEAAIKKALVSAISLDHAFQCRWRERDVKKREERVREILDHILDTMPRDTLI